MCVSHVEKDILGQQTRDMLTTRNASNVQNLVGRWDTDLWAMENICDAHVTEASGSGMLHAVDIEDSSNEERSPTRSVSMENTRDVELSLIHI